MPKHATNPDSNVTTPQRHELPWLAQEINREHVAVKAALRDSVLHAEVAGRWLIQAKEKLKHGEWETWVDEHTDVSPRTVRMYMQVARELPKMDEAKRQRVADLNLRQVVEIIADLPVPYKVPMPGATNEEPMHIIGGPRRPDNAA